MMNEALSIQKQIDDLDQWIKSNPDSRELKRAIAVKLSLQGWVYRAIAQLLNVSDSSIGDWKKRFKEQGVEGLKLSYKGAKSYLTKEQREQVLTWLKSQEYWDLSELECYLIESYDVVFKSPTSYYNLLKEAKISWQKAQGKNPRQDPELVKKKNQEIREVLEKLLPSIRNRNVAVYAIDEVHLLEGDLISHLWGDSKERLNVPINNQKNRQTYYGALDLINPELIIEESEKGNGEYTIDFLNKLLKKNPTKKIIIFWDGAAYHRCQKIQEFLLKINGGLSENDWRITCHLFAPYAPEENPIEAVWLALKTLLRRCYRFCKNFRIMNKIFKLLVDFNLFNFPNLRNYDAFSCLI